MSARPRPVTATFMPDGEVESRQRGGSVTTGSSTASLLSVLDHDSCNDDDESPIRFVQRYLRSALLQHLLRF